MKTSVKISSDGSETGALLVEYLKDRNVYDSKGQATVCYGLSSRNRPALNHSCQSDKITRMRAMNNAGIRTVPWFDAKRVPANVQFPILARKMYGMGGKDIATIFQREEIDWRIAAGWDWFSEYVPVARELRCWVYRDEVLDTFEKVMRRPQDYTKIGRNFGNGFEFELVGEHTEAYKASIETLRALGLDFGAIDLLVGKDGLTYVLEANTAPGVIRSGAQATLGKFADRIVNWLQNGAK